MYMYVAKYAPVLQTQQDVYEAYLNMDMEYNPCVSFFPPVVPCSPSTVLCCFDFLPNNTDDQSKTPSPLFFLSVYFLHPPTHRQHPRSQEARHGDGVRERREEDQRHPALLLGLADAEERAGDGQAGEGAEAAGHHGGGVEAAVLAGLAQLADADGVQAEVAAGGEAEGDGEDDQHGPGVGGGQPEGEDGDDAERVRQRDDVEAAEAVGEESREEAADEGSRVE